MDELLSAQIIADALNVNKRTVLMQSNREKWECKETPSKTGGGLQKEFYFSLLPNDIKARIFQHQHQVPPELLPQGELDIDRLKGRTERYNRASEKDRCRAHARNEILKAIKDFCAQKGFGQTRGEKVFILFYQDKKAPGINEDIYQIEKNISVATIRRWRSAFKEEGLAGLLPNYRSTQGQLKAITPDIQIFIISHIKQNPRIRPSHLFKIISKTFKPGPSRRSIYRFVDKWKLENPELWAMIEDPQRWKNNFMAAAGDMAAGIDYFCHTWEADSTPADIITADGKRCTIVGIIDVYTRKAMLFVAPTSKSTAIAACMRKGLIAWGVPGVIRRDNGKDYTSKHIDSIVISLGIETPLLPKHAPEKKPFIERFFGTLSVGLEELLPGYCGHSVAERQSIRARETWSTKIMTPGAIIEIPQTMAELQGFCDQWLKIYENSEHSGINGKTPYQRFKESSYFPPKVRDERVLDILLAPMSKPRRILKKGIAIDGPFYWADELMEYMGQRVQCRRDLENAGLVYVFKIKDGSFICKATNEPLSDQRLEDYLIAKKQHQKSIKEKVKALDSLSLGNRNALQIMMEDVVTNKQYNNIVPLQFEADTPAIREAKKAVCEPDNAPLSDPLQEVPLPKCRNSNPINPAFVDYKTDEDLDRDFNEIVEEANKKKALDLRIGRFL
ncbi:MAG: DDE-type integrase/transposase/recombinase [Proteobacteria bacterium]|nr:DDE-type integrase/transposase/recombinase [Pseudomonadota bacterium]MBU4471161.1 DDE-type integrase/transposase/recombinase [Pseudomonadota bacterium]MCG2751834.1 Mu transposase C-terminal domain-containing protein [Desulfobacteraceae bacterium]